MKPQTVIQLILLVLLIALSSFFSASETALTSVSRLRFRHLTKEKVRNAGKILKLLEDPNRLLGAILVGNNIVNIGASALATSLAMDYFGSAGVGIATGVMTLLVLIFGEITPKSWAVQHAERFSLRIAPIIRILIIVTGPILVLLLYITNFLIRLTGADAEQKKSIITTEELRSMVDVGHEEGILEVEEHKMMRNVLEFGDLPVRAVMTPRTDLVALPDNAGYEQLRDTFHREQVSKIPVYAKTLDHITGILNVKNLVFIEDGEGFQLLEHITPPFFTYEFIKVRDLFQELRSRRISLAVVLDEYGGTVGIITMEDLIEEIFGELEDTLPNETLDFILVQGDEFLVGGSARVDEINELLGTHIRGDEYDTIAGFIIFELGYLPLPGDSLDYRDHRFLVEEVQGRRIAKIRITARP